MTAIQFLAEWALRSSILILIGALLLWVLRIKDPSVRLAAWVAMLCGSLAIPALSTLLPKVPVAVLRSAPPVQALSRPAPAIDSRSTQPAPSHTAPEVLRKGATAAAQFDWAGVALGIYFLIAAAMLARLSVGLLLSRRLLRASRATGQSTHGIEIRESRGIGAPAAIGIARPVILLPTDWRDWDQAKLDAVLAHERSHILRNDPAVQLLSAIHRALVWHSPLSWYLHRRIVRVAEEASDDAAVAVTRDRASYAEMLLEFMRRGLRRASWQGVAMARYGSPEQRIGRILEGTALSRGVTRGSVLAILALASPVAYVVAAAQTDVAAAAPSASMRPVAAAPEVTGAPVAPRAAVSPAIAAPGEDVQQAAAPASASEPATPPSAPRRERSIRRYMIFSNDSISGSWDSDDRVDEQELRAKFGQHFAWFRQGGSDYVVTDAGVMSQLEKAMEPQRAVNRMQEEVNKQQAVVNQHQADVNRAQNAVNEIQASVNRRQHLINELQSAKGDDELIRKLEAMLQELRENKGEAGHTQDAANRAQDKVNQMQGRVNDEQGKVNEQQGRVNEEQQRVSEKFEGKIEEILGSALERHLAQPIK